jgi:hypothetical protein
VLSKSKKGIDLYEDKNYEFEDEDIPSYSTGDIHTEQIYDFVLHFDE